eukprot:TRINITY_DN11819_c0_g3_i1.p1 TRINITY_DN11819_c0_g3~~TRINITY_DN11819_c0_g3_i1.p1  ORF type:complete len:234 (+),score=29.87 TRINITY_DN11819_c0_g3_i1:167-868(+)
MPAGDKVHTYGDWTAWLLIQRCASCRVRNPQSSAMTCTEGSPLLPHVETSSIGHDIECKWQHPPSFYCPISQQCMHDPVVLADGHSYERRYIEKWLKDHSTSPVSGLQLDQLAIFPNHALRNAIEEYFEQVFSAHRRAIRRTMTNPDSSEQGLGSNASLLRTIDALMQCSLLMGADQSTESTLRQIMDEAKMLLCAEAASVFLVDAQNQVLYSTINSLNKSSAFQCRKESQDT